MTAFLLIKPDGMRFIKWVEKETELRGIKIKSKVKFYEWQRLAPLLYKQRLERGSTEFRADFKIHLWLQSHFFGNTGEVFLLETGGVTLEEEVKKAYDLRNALRDTMYQLGDDRIQIIVNGEQFEEVLAQEASGYYGYLGVREEEGGFAPLSCESTQKGKWDIHCFKYVHAPDSVEEFLFQAQVLREELKILL